MADELEPVCGCKTVKSLQFIYFLIHFISDYLFIIFNKKLRTLHPFSKPLEWNKLINYTIGEYQTKNVTALYNCKEPKAQNILSL